jgi:hypothetical protein
MKTLTAQAYNREFLKSIFIDTFALAVIYFTPVLAHLISFPVYMIEPMRLMIILSMAHSSRRNSYLLAFTLPLFSYIATSHPEFFKMLIITAELVLNVFFFYWLCGKMKNIFVAMVSSIIASKVICYLLYLIFFSIAFVRNEADLLFLFVQLLTTILFSAYIYFFWKKNNQTINENRVL